MTERIATNRRGPESVGSDDGTTTTGGTPAPNIFDTSFHYLDQTDVHMRAASSAAHVVPMSNAESLLGRSLLRSFSVRSKAPRVNARTPVEGITMSSTGREPSARGVPGARIRSRRSVRHGRVTVDAIAPTTDWDRPGSGRKWLHGRERRLYLHLASHPQTAEIARRRRYKPYLSVLHHA